jgi:IS30 family transposase
MPYSHYIIDERNALQVMEAMRLPKWNIAVIFGKHISSVCRELKRNGEGGIYTAAAAQQRAEQRRFEAKPCPVTGNNELMETVKTLFKEDWAPEQTAGRLTREEPGKRVSPETIYRYLYEEVRKEPELKAHFRHPRLKRRPRRVEKDKRGQIPDRVSIEHRPAIVEDKVRVGDWEGDTVEGAGKTAYVATFVDKTAKYLLAKVMPDKSARTLNLAARRAYKAVPAEFINTLTVDNGKEFAWHKALGEQIGCAVYFAHPYHSWERGLNEHTNGLLRQYLPKGMSFDTLTQGRLDKIVNKINNRPRKSLGYRTPAEVFFRACNFALQI